MALYDGFFDAVYDEETEKYDRTYDANDFDEYTHQFIGSGVCVHDNPDSMKVFLSGNEAVVMPGYLFIRGGWLCNKAGPDEDQATYRGYALPLTGSGTLAILAHRNDGKRMMELLVQPYAQSIPDDSLLLALINTSTGTVEDKRQKLDSVGGLNGKVEYAINYINNEIDGKLSQIEASINAKGKELDAKIAQVQALVESLAPPPVGAIKFTANPDPGEGWIKCDGQFINRADYPELVDAIGKVYPGVYQFLELARENTNFASNTIILGKWKINYFYDASRGNKLHYVKRESTTIGGTTAAMDGTSEILHASASPVYLSIANGHFFLAQVQDGYPVIWMSEETYSDNETVFSAPTMKSYNSKSLLVQPSDTYGFTGFKSRFAIPYVIYKDGSYYVVAGTGDSSYGSTVYAYAIVLKFTSLSNVSVLKYGIPNVFLNDSMKSTGTTNAYSMLGFSQKNSNECVYASITSRYPQPISSVSSFLVSLYHLGNASTVITDANDPSQPNTVNIGLYCLPVMGNKQMFSGMKIQNDRIVVVSYTESGPLANLSVPLKLPTTARTFYDSVIYMEDKRMWLLFVGTGLVFTNELSNPDAYGYYDTQETLGAITQYGHLLYDEEEKILTISGVTSNGEFRLANMAFNDFYDYADTGTWLPSLYSNGIPAYIKAKPGGAR